MASCNMASAASRFLVATPNVASNTTSRTNMLFFPSNKITTTQRLVVRAAAEEAAAPAAAATAEPAVETKAAKPPPIGPKRGSKVRLLVFVYSYRQSSMVYLSRTYMLLLYYK